MKSRMVMFVGLFVAIMAISSVASAGMYDGASAVTPTPRVTGMYDGASALTPGARPNGMYDGASALNPSHINRVKRVKSSGVITLAITVQYANGARASNTGVRVTLASNGAYIGGCTTNSSGNCNVQFVYYGSGSSVRVNESASVCSNHTFFYSPTFSPWVWTGTYYATLTLSYAVSNAC